MSLNPSSGIPARSDAPVFIVGSPRSGTTLLYHMLLSAGRFVRYRTETHLFNSLGPRYGGLRTPVDREQALALWLASDLHLLSALPAEEVAARIRSECRHTGDFLRLIMMAMAARQEMARWAECTPAHLLHLHEIRTQVPGALFVHVVRDGRDVAVSMARQGWIRPLPGQRGRPAVAAAAYWRWLVERGRTAGRALGGSYCEVRYEDLLATPAETLDRLGGFIGQPLDWEEIQRVGIGSVSNPNTSFPDAQGGFVGRWATELSPQDARDIDGLLAGTLRSLGYPTESPGPSVGARTLGMLYAARFAGRDWLKRRTPLGRRSTDLSIFQPGAGNVTAEKVAQAGPTLTR